MPKGDIRLTAQILRRTIVTIIVHEKEMINALLAVVFKEIGKADFFIPQGTER